MTTDLARLLLDPDELSDPMSLSEIPHESATIFAAQEGGSAFNLHSYICRHDGLFFACWSSGLRDEEGPGQVIRYAASEDGLSWSEPGVLAEPDPTPDGPGICIARGLFEHDGTLYALVAKLDELEPGIGWVGLRLTLHEYAGASEGDIWRDRGVLIDDAINNFPPHRIGDRWLMTIRVGARDRFYVATATDPAGTWRLHGFPGDNVRISEPSWYVDPEGVAHMIIRDTKRTKVLLHSVSTDEGSTWSEPVETNYPDATSKNYTLRLADGRYCLINNPNPSSRDPLAITVSANGNVFGNPRALCKNAPFRRFEGRAKPERSFQYPHALEHDGFLYVIYSVNKEDIVVSRYLVENLPPAPA